MRNIHYFRLCASLRKNTAVLLKFMDFRNYAVYRRTIPYFTDPESAYLHHKWAAATPIIVFGILYIMVRAVNLNLNMIYLFSIYAAASYSAWTWGKSIKKQKEKLKTD